MSYEAHTSFQLVYVVRNNLELLIPISIPKSWTHRHMPPYHIRQMFTLLRWSLVSQVGLSLLELLMYIITAAFLSFPFLLLLLVQL